MALTPLADGPLVGAVAVELALASARLEARARRSRAAPSPASRAGIVRPGRHLAGEQRDGVYAEARLARGLPGWRYPLTRWWSYGLARGWATPVEYHAPPWGAGSPSNAWSAMPAAAMLLGGFGLTPAGAVRPPPWGESVLTRRGPDGRPVRVAVHRDGEGLRMEVDHG